MILRRLHPAPFNTFLSRYSLREASNDDNMAVLFIVIFHIDISLTCNKENGTAATNTVHPADLVEDDVTFGCLPGTFPAKTRLALWQHAACQHCCFCLPPTPKKTCTAAQEESGMYLQQGITLHTCRGNPRATPQCSFKHRQQPCRFITSHNK